HPRRRGAPPAAVALLEHLRRALRDRQLDARDRIGIQFRQRHRRALLIAPAEPQNQRRQRDHCAQQQQTIAQRTFHRRRRRTPITIPMISRTIGTATSQPQVTSARSVCVRWITRSGAPRGGKETSGSSPSSQSNTRWPKARLPPLFKYVLERKSPSPITTARCSLLSGLGDRRVSANPKSSGPRSSPSEASYLIVEGCVGSIAAIWFQLCALLLKIGWIDHCAPLAAARAAACGNSVLTWKPRVIACGG